MILLDTDVLSALRRSEPDAVVVDWLDAQPSESIWTTSVMLFEIRTGLELMPSSRRRRTEAVTHNGPGSAALSAWAQQRLVLQ